MLDANPKLFFAAAESIGDMTVKAVSFPTQPPFNTTYFEVLPHCSTLVDEHQVEECWIILQGTGRLEFDGKVFAAQAKDIFYFPSFSKHQLHNVSDELLIVCSLYWQPAANNAN